VHDRNRPRRGSSPRTSTAPRLRDVFAGADGCDHAGLLRIAAGDWTDLLQAAAKAGFVGGIADWFAVTALFRHPLGIPIPHTAIIPHQKERLGARARPFRRQSRHHVGRGLGVARTAGCPRHSVAVFQRPGHRRGPPRSHLAALLPRILATVEDGRARRVASRIIPRVLGGPGAGVVVARALRTLVEGGRHQEVFGFILEQMKTLLGAQEETLRWRSRNAFANKAAG
jgi:uncharacterized membrane-anchored protein YjiN (DUF445 family)